MSHSPLISLENVTVERDLTTILQEFSWQAGAGQNWVIFGPNGAGKTSLLNVIVGYMWPTSGTVEVLGERLGQVDVRELRRLIPFVSDSLRHMINASLTAYEVILTGPRAHLNLFDDPTPEEFHHAEEMIALTRLPRALLNRPFAVLSTGERQRVLIARALMSRPRILILDEPCSGLDLAGREIVLQTIERIASLPQAPALLLTTHHVEEITSSFTHALLLKKGKLHNSGALEEVFTGAALTELFEYPLKLQKSGGRYQAWGS